MHMALWLGCALLAASCSLGNPRLTSADGELRGREIALAVDGVPGGFRVRGRMRVAVPPPPLLALTYHTEKLVRLFPDHVAGVGRWRLGAGEEERFFFAAKLFGRVFRAWGHMSREDEPGRAAVRWRTDKGARGGASATRKGRGSEVYFEGFFPAGVDIARFLPRIGVELMLRLMAFAIRSKVEQLWRDGQLAERADAREPASAGIAPKSPWPAVRLAPAAIPGARVP
jgi:hypothetical protein